MAVVSEKRSFDGGSHRPPHREQSRHQHEKLRQPPAQAEPRIMSGVGDRLDRLRRISLAAVLRESGAQRDRYDTAKWHTPKGAISITGLKFMNWHRSAGGGGAIDLAMHLNGLGFPAAVAWLQRHFPLPLVAESPPAARRLALPPPDCGRLSAVRHYLAHDRAIPPSLTNSLLTPETPQ